MGVYMASSAMEFRMIDAQYMLNQVFPYLGALENHTTYKRIVGYVFFFFFFDSPLLHSFWLPE